MKSTKKRMTPFIALIAVVFSTSCAFASDLTIDAHRCYSATRPTAVRKAIDSDVIDNLPQHKSFRILSAGKRPWFLVEYSENHDQNTCPPVGKIKKGWVVEDSVGMYETSLLQLVREGRVLIAGKEITVNEEQLHSFLGEKTRVIKADVDDTRGVLKPMKPLHVNIYCLDKKPVPNRITSVNFDYGGDAGSYAATITTKSKVPKGTCIFVNGIIEQTLTPVDEELPEPSKKLCQDVHTNGYFCKINRGKSEADGPGIAVSKEGSTAGPTYTRWRIYQQAPSGEHYLLGLIGFDSAP